MKKVNSENTSPNNHDEELRKKSEVLSYYSAKELAHELKNRLTEKFRAKATPRRAGKPKHIRDALRSEIELVTQMEPISRKNLYEIDELSPEEKLLEKMWWWITDGGAYKHKHWDNYWLQKHTVKNVGMNNVRNREIWLEEALKNISSGSKILDAGAGELQYKRFCGHLDYLSQDFGQYTGEGNSEGLQTGVWDNSKLDIVSDITDIPVVDKSFDAVMCIEVFEHIPKPIEAIKEFSRILKPGGTLIITAPFACLTHFAPYFYYNGYSKYFYEALLDEHGFDIEEINFNGNYFEYLAQELHRLDEVSSTYVGSRNRLSPTEQLAKQVLLRRLEKLSKLDKGSNELLAHGINVKAIKR